MVYRRSLVHRTGGRDYDIFEFGDEEGFRIFPSLDTSMNLSFRGSRVLKDNTPISGREKNRILSQYLHEANHSDINDPRFKAYRNGIQKLLTAEACSTPLSPFI